jgi:SAM-dependent methyltransferase
MLSPTAGLLPNAVYRREFFDSVMAEGPASILDVGCGDGAFLKAASARGCRVHGVDTDEARITKLQSEDLSAKLARAEELPFENASFDVVTFSYTTHHLAELPRALAEAVRVARRAVLILDGWYDTAVPSQRVAEAFDLWSKAIDRRLGMVHNPLPSAAELVALVSGRPSIAATDYAHRLILAPWPISEVRNAAEEQSVALGGFDAETEAALARILDEAARVGISRDGALMLRIGKTL